MSKTVTKYGLIGLVLIIIFVLFTRSCRLYDENSVLKGKYEAYRKIATIDHERLITEINKQTDIITEKNKAIEKILADAAKPNPLVAAQDKLIKDQQKKIADLEEQGDLSGALQAAKEEIGQWSEKFRIAEEQHGAELFDLNAAWQAKFDAQVVISESWKQDWTNEHNLRLLAEKRIGGLESSLKHSKLIDVASTMLVVGFSGAIAYNLLLKGK